MSGAHEHKPVREERQPARDEIEEVVPGILRLQLPISFPGLGHVNCYAMEDKRGVALVDPGLPGLKTSRMLAQRLKQAGLSIDRVHTVVITHSHPDHFGQVPHLKRKAQAEIITHRHFRTLLDPAAEWDDEVLTTTLEDAEAAVTAGPDQDIDRPLNPRQRGFWRETPWGGKPYEIPRTRRLAYRFQQFAAGRFMATPSPTRRISDADRIMLGDKEWIAVHSPGHTRDHLCLWDADGDTMISGDHVLPTITPHISGLGETKDPLADFFNSLDRMTTFNGVRTVLPAHGLDFSDLSGRVTAIKRHHEERLDTLREASGELGVGTVEEYMKRLFVQKSWSSMAESETFAHLEHLRFLGEAEAHRDDEFLRYELS
ncbi:MAG: MBL fold metallo-hydrolase [Actinomycetia bacterium]|nr:MBL fold metallo-hydrolase [Actinomycetes bacterium]